MKIGSLIKPLISKFIKDIERNDINTVSFTFKINQGDFNLDSVVYIDPDTQKAVKCSYEEFEQRIKRNN